METGSGLPTILFFYLVSSPHGHYDIVKLIFEVNLTFIENFPLDLVLRSRSGVLKSHDTCNAGMPCQTIYFNKTGSTNIL